MNQHIEIICRVLSAFFLVLLIQPGAQARNAVPEEVLIVATDYPPYEFQYPENGLKGFDVEVAVEAFKRAGIKARVEFYPWARALEMIRRGEADAVLSCANVPSRDDFILLSDSIITVTGIFLVNKNYTGPPIHNWEDIKELKLVIGSTKGNMPVKLMEESNMRYDLSSTEEVAYRKLEDGRIDVMPTVLENVIYQYQGVDYKTKFKWFEMKSAYPKDFHLGFCKMCPESQVLVSIFNEKLAEMKKDGTYDAIHDKYK